MPSRARKVHGHVKSFAAGALGVTSAQALTRAGAPLWLLVWTGVAFALLIGLLEWRSRHMLRWCIALVLLWAITGGIGWRMQVNAVAAQRRAVVAQLRSLRDEGTRLVKEAEQQPPAPLAPNQNRAGYMRRVDDYNRRTEAFVRKNLGDAYVQRLVVTRYRPSQDAPDSVSAAGYAEGYSVVIITIEQLDDFIHELTQ